MIASQVNLIEFISNYSSGHKKTLESAGRRNIFLRRKKDNVQ